MKRIRRLVKPTSSEVATGIPQHRCLCPYGRASQRVIRAATKQDNVIVTVYLDHGVSWLIPSVFRSERWNPLSPAARKRVLAFDTDDPGQQDRTSPWPGFYITIELPTSSNSFSPESAVKAP